MGTTTEARDVNVSFLFLFFLILLIYIIYRLFTSPLPPLHHATAWRPHNADTNLNKQGAGARDGDGPGARDATSLELRYIFFRILIYFLLLTFLYIDCMYGPPLSLHPTTTTGLKTRQTCL